MTPSSTCSSTFIIKSNLGQIKRVEAAEVVGRGGGVDVCVKNAAEIPSFYSSVAVYDVKRKKQNKNKTQSNHRYTYVRVCLLKKKKKSLAGSPDV